MNKVIGSISKTDGEISRTHIIIDIDQQKYHFPSFDRAQAFLSKKRDEKQEEIHSVVILNNGDSGLG